MNLRRKVDETEAEWTIDNHTTTRLTRIVKSNLRDSVQKRVDSSIALKCSQRKQAPQRTFTPWTMQCFRAALTMTVRKNVFTPSVIPLTVWNKAKEKADIAWVRCIVNERRHRTLLHQSLVVMSWKLPSAHCNEKVCIDSNDWRRRSLDGPHYSSLQNRRKRDQEHWRRSLFSRQEPIRHHTSLYLHHRAHIQPNLHHLYTKFPNQPWCRCFLPVTAETDCALWADSRHHPTVSGSSRFVLWCGAQISPPVREMKNLA